MHANPGGEARPQPGSTRRPGLVDVHSHAMPMQVLEWLEGERLADLSGVADGYVLLDPSVSGAPRGARIPLARSQFDDERRINEMDAHGVDAAAVTLPPFLIAATHPDAGFVVELVSRGNQALREWCGSSPGRLIPLPTVPLGLPAYDPATMESIVGHGHPGVGMGTSGLGAELDDPRHEDLWAALEASGIFVFLHPSRVSAPERHADYWLTQLVGYPAETALAVARLVLSGALERHDVAVVLAHGGGCIGSLRGRLDLGWRTKSEARTLPAPPSAYLDRLYYDTAVFSDVELRHVAEVVGVDHLVVGTDWPFDLADADPASTLDSLPRPDVVRDVVRKTARRLLGLHTG